MLPSLSNQAVLVSNAYAGSTPLYAALSFLQSHQDRTVIIYTPIKSVYPKSSQDPIDIEEGLDWRLAEDDATSSIDTKLKADEWFLHNGLRGSTAALLARIQIMHALSSNVPSITRLTASQTRRFTRTIGNLSRGISKRPTESGSHRQRNAHPSRHYTSPQPSFRRLYPLLQ